MSIRNVEKVLDSLPYRVGVGQDVVVESNPPSGADTPSAASIGKRGWDFWALLALIGAVLVVFGRICWFGFVLWDDNIHFQENQYLTSASGVAHIWSSAYEYLYIPVFYSFVRLISAGAPPNPHVLHFVSLILHCANVALVYKLLRSLKISAPAALAGAALFAVHPLQVESVAWAAELRGLLSSFFALLAMQLYLNYARKAGERLLDRNMPWMCGIFLCYVCGMLTKPSIVTLPLIFFAIDWWEVATPVRAAMRRSLPFLLAALPIVLITQQSQPILRYMSVSIWQRPVVLLDTFAFYLWKLALPLNLGMDYGRTPIKVVGEHGLVWICLVPLAALAGLLLWRGRPRHLTLGVWIFVAALLPVSGIVPFAYEHYSTVADRYCYLALLGPAILLALVVERKPGAISWTGLAILAFAVLAFAQTATWRNSVALFGQALRVNPHCYIAVFNTAFIRDREGRLDEAIADYNRAASIDRNEAEPFVAIARAYIRQAKPVDALAAYQRAVIVDAKCTTAYVEAANILENEHQYTEVVSLYRQGITAQPGSALLHNNLGIAYAMQHDDADAQNEFQAVLDIDPENEDAHRNMARLHTMSP